MITRSRKELWSMLATMMTAAALTLLTPHTAQANDALNLCFDHSAPIGAAVSVPADDSIHYDTVLHKYVHMYEEWYKNCDFNAGGTHFGCENLFFEFHFPPELLGLPSNFPQVVVQFSQMSLTDVSADFYKNDFIELFDFSGTGAQPKTNGYNFHIADPTTGVAMDSVGGAGRDVDTITFADGTKLKMFLESIKKPMYSFDNGIGRFVDPTTGKSHGLQYYYQRPEWVFVGSLEQPGQAIKLAIGEAEQDREFGTVIGTPGTKEDNVHWLWNLLHDKTNLSEIHMWDMVANDTNNTLIHIVNRLGPPPWCIQQNITDFSHTQSGTIVNPQNPAETYSLYYTLTIPSIGVNGIWTSITNYPQIANTGLFDGTLEGDYVFRPALNQAPTGEGYVEETHGCCQRVKKDRKKAQRHTDVQYRQVAQ